MHMNNNFILVAFYFKWNLSSAVQPKGSNTAYVQL